MLGDNSKINSKINPMFKILILLFLILLPANSFALHEVTSSYNWNFNSYSGSCVYYWGAIDYPNIEGICQTYGPPWRYYAANYVSGAGRLYNYSTSCPSHNACLKSYVNTSTYLGYTGSSPNTAPISDGDFSAGRFYAVGFDSKYQNYTGQMQFMLAPAAYFSANQPCLGLAHDAFTLQKVEAADFRTYFTTTKAGYQVDQSTSIVPGWMAYDAVDSRYDLLVDNLTMKEAMFKKSTNTLLIGGSTTDPSKQCGDMSSACWTADWIQTGLGAGSAYQTGTSPSMLRMYINGGQSGLIYRQIVTNSLISLDTGTCDGIDDWYYMKSVDSNRKLHIGKAALILAVQDRHARLEEELENTTTAWKERTQ